MIALCTLILLILASLGAGAALLRCLTLHDRLDRIEGLGWAFALGFGTMGWSMFFLAVQGWLQIWYILTLCLCFLPGLRWLPHGREPAVQPVPTWRLILLSVIVSVILGQDVLEALAPPADADSLAYHFALPRHTLTAGHLVFIERALDATSPQLSQMTYMAALALGGERAMTLWAMVSGWGIAFLAFGLARRHLPVDWALAVSAAILSLPAMLYSGGTGQVEPRTAMFFFVAALAAGRCHSQGNLGWAAAAGLAAGFFAASKYTGLLTVFACGVALLATSGRWRMTLLYSLAVMVAGSQWYAWNAWNTGDPFFPLLYGVVPYHPQTTWTQEQAIYMKESLTPLENFVPKSLGWFLAYPFVAVMAGHPGFESSRTGFGVWPLLFLPFTLLAAWRLRKQARDHEMLWPGIIVFLVYSLWFFLGSSQRVRHYLPLIPIFMVILTVGAHRAGRLYSLTKPLWVSIAVILALQLAGQAMFSLKFVRHFVTGGDRDRYFVENVNFYDLVMWLDNHIDPTDKVLMPVREVDYLITQPSFQANRYIESAIDIRPQANDPVRFLAQLRRQGIKVIVSGPESGFAAGGESLDLLSRALVQQGCASGPQIVTTRGSIPSRTLSGGPSGQDRFYVYRVLEEECTLSLPARSPQKTD